MEAWKILRDRTKCRKPMCPLAGESEYYAILQLPDCIRLSRCKQCFHELKQDSGDDLPFHWMVRRTTDGKQKPVIDMASLRTLFDKLGESIQGLAEAEEDPAERAQASNGATEPAGAAQLVTSGDEAAPRAASDPDAAETAAGLRYLVALLLLRKRRLKMVDASNAEEERADLVVVDPKIEGMEPVALFAPELDPERLENLREELTAAIGEG